jgi:hypothetical protein
MNIDYIRLNTDEVGIANTLHKNPTIQETNGDNQK